MSLETFLSDLMMDLKIELTDEFDQNFQRKAFFNKSWPKNKLLNRKGSMMARTNNLRNSVQSRIVNDSIVFTSSLPYAFIQNEGGEITVTKKMKKFFWFKYMELTEKVKKSGSVQTRSSKISIEAMQWKAMALKPEGSKIVITQRQFIGHHPRVDKIVKDVCDENVKRLRDDIKKRFNPKK